MNKIPCSPRKSCCDCMWNYEGDCNLSHVSGFEDEWQRYEPDESPYEFKPCYYRVEYFDWEEWFIANKDGILEVKE